MKRILIVVIALGMLMPGQARAGGLGVRVYYWAPAVSGDIRVDGDKERGEVLDFTDTLGLENVPVPIVEVYAGAANQNMSLAYARTRSSGTRTLSEEMRFGGERYPVRDIICSRLLLTAYDFTYGYSLIATPIIELGVLSRATFINGSMSVSSALRPMRREKNFRSPIPMLGVNLRLGLLHFLEINGVACGGYAQGKAYEGRAELVFKPVALVGLHGGYRSQVFTVDQDQVRFTLNDSGPYLALTLGF
ncbi:MAG: hypothetical protein ABFD81_13590 [Syntrophaceae bacterium]